MTLFQALILGIVQGLTEFLPISSSAHLVLTPFILGWDIPDDEAFIFNVLVQLATLLGVILYFRQDLVKIVAAVLKGLWNRQLISDPYARLGWQIVVATIPAGLIGLVLKEYVEKAFSSVAITAVFLICTGVLLLISERIGKRNRLVENLGWKDSLLIGLFQAISIFPGISRSGSTITGGMARHLERPAAARFSFLMSIPIMLAAGLLASLDLKNNPIMLERLPVYLPGFLAAALVGYLAIAWLLGFLTRRPLYLFSIYCFTLGLTILAIMVFR
jgi:undecaprenyl-diphosphatase